MSENVLILFATRDGQTKKIAEFFAEKFRERKVEARIQELPRIESRRHYPLLADSMKTAIIESQTPALILVIAPIRYGFHVPEAEFFLKDYEKHFGDIPLAVASVNLTARKPNKDTPKGNVYLRKLIKRHKLKPVAATAIAGKLDYPRYNWIDRQLIRFIMMITGGPTDKKASVEYTDWGKTADFSRQLSSIISLKKQ